MIKCQIIFITRRHKDTKKANLLGCHPFINGRDRKATLEIIQAGGGCKTVEQQGIAWDQNGVSATGMRKTIGWAAGALFYSFVVFWLAVPLGDKSGVTYEGRTVEDWVSNPDWDDEITDAEMAIMMLGEKAVEPLREILRLKSPDWAVSTAWKIPFGDRIFKRPLQNVVKKQRAIECLEAVDWVGDRLHPEIIAMAENKKEFLSIRQVALRYIFRHMPLTTEKSNILVRLTGDKALGPEAARYVGSFQRQFRDEELSKIAGEIHDRFDSTERSGSDPLATTNSIFKEHGSLWEAGQRED